MEFLKSISGRIVTGLVALGVVAAAFPGGRWTNPPARPSWPARAGSLAWFGVMLAWPWVSFAIIARVAKLESNLAGGVLVGAYTIAEVVLLAWLFHWHLPNATAWTFLLLGGLVSGVYNLLTCDWIAEKV